MTRSKTLWGWSLIAAFGVLGACGGKAYDRAFAGLTRTPIDPPSAELSARFCLDAARTFYRQAQVDRALGNTGLIVGGLTVAVTSTLWLQEGDTNRANQKTLERASEVGFAVGLTGMALGGVAHLVACNKREEALMRVEAAVRLVALAERLEQVESDLTQCQEDLDDGTCGNDEASLNKRMDLTDDCQTLGPEGKQDPCFAFEFERCSIRRELIIALGPCVGLGRLNPLASVVPLSAHITPHDEASSASDSSASDSSASDSSASDSPAPAPAAAPTAPGSAPAPAVKGGP